MNASIRVAVTGMGAWGKNLVRNFHALGALGVICDSEASREATAREQYPDVLFVTDYERVLADDTIQAVVIAAPAAAHHSMARAALEAGKDVFVEKPLALDPGQGKELVDVARRTGRLLMVGHILRYHPAVVKLDELIRSGELGRLQYLYSNRLNMGTIRSEENILWSFAPHDISVMLALLGEEPCQVTCEGSAFLSRNVADVTMSQFVFPSGVRAHIFVSWLHPLKEQRLVVVGSEKMAVFNDMAEHKLILFPNRIRWQNRRPSAVKAESMPVLIEDAEPLRTECAHFLECVATRRQPRSDGAEGLRVLNVLEACQRALDESAGQPAVDSCAVTPAGVGTNGRRGTVKADEQRKPQRVKKVPEPLLPSFTPLPSWTRRARSARAPGSGTSRT